MGAFSTPTPSSSAVARTRRRKLPDFLARRGSQVRGDAFFEPDLLRLRVDASDETIAVQERTDVPAPPPLVRRLVDFPDVVEVEDVAHEIAIPEQRIERPEEPD